MEELANAAKHPEQERQEKRKGEETRGRAGRDEGKLAGGQRGAGPLRAPEGGVGAEPNPPAKAPGGGLGKR